MIEVEKKFILTSEQSARLIADATLVGKKEITDVYYDNATYDLTRGDKWLRKRNSRFELKLPIGDNDSGVFIYNELENDAEICRTLGLDDSSPLEAVLKKAGYNPFCVCKTTRTKYTLGEFNLDLDKAEFDDFEYEVAEIELMAESEEYTKAAERKIEKIAASYGLSNEGVRGKIVAYIARKRPQHFEALKQAWGDPHL